MTKKRATIETYLNEIKIINEKKQKEKMFYEEYSMWEFEEE